MPYTRSHAAVAVGIVVLLCQALASAQSDSPRVDRLIDPGWRFIRQDVVDAQAPTFDDSAWQQINLPHTWTQEIHNDRATYYSGPCWYRYHLSVEPALAGKRLFLRFGAASRVSQVYVNGQLAGTHRGAFGAFCVPISDYAHEGDNVVAVRADNAGDPEVAPLSGDFTTYGGLFRSVRLLALDPVHVTPLDDAGPGVYLRASVGDESAAVHAACKLRNDGAQPALLKIIGTVRDASGQTVATATADTSLPAATGADANLELAIPHPHRWDGRRDPYLYETTIEIVRDGKTVDRVVQPLGLRTFKVDPHTGLTLNGHPYDLHGVNYHEGRVEVGFADTPQMQAEDNALICEMGCTGVRMAHYQHDDNEYALCDKAGLIVWAELALVNRMNDTPAFRDNIKQQLRELIKQNYNHPSVFFWSMYNEVWVTADKGSKANTEEEWKLVGELVELAHELDPDRLTTGATVRGVNGPVATYMDITGTNRYDGWYDNSPQSWPKTLEEIRKTFPTRSMGIGEYGAGASVKQHSNPTTRPKPADRWHPEEWQCIVHENAYDAIRREPWLWCKFIWVMFDFGSVGRNEGDTPGINDKGLVTVDRKVRKDAFYFYKAHWTNEPFVHVTERRFSPRPAGKADLKIYSNCDSVELKIDGQSLGSKTAANHVFEWPAVTLTGQTAAVEAFGRRGDQSAADSVTWTLTAP